MDQFDDSLSEQSSEDEGRAQQQLDMREHCADLFDRSAVHLRRAMVLYTPTDQEPHAHISGVPMQIYNVQNMIPLFHSAEEKCVKMSEYLGMCVCAPY